jgi:hypothetical protein
VLDEETYLRGRVYPTEGGPKGLDIDKDMAVLAVTSALETLTFFDAGPILVAASSCQSEPAQAGNDLALKNDLGLNDDLALKYELERQDELNRTLIRAEAAEAQADQVSARAALAEIQVAALLGSTSWRVTTPLRLVSTRLRELKAQLGKTLAGGGPA